MTWSTPCNSPVYANLPVIHFDFPNGVRLSLDRDLYMYTNDRQKCECGIVGASGMAIFGNLFLRRYYTIFDLERRQIGFSIANRAVAIDMNLKPDYY